MICIFWFSQSNKPALKIINKFNSRNAAKSRNTFDFWTVNNKLPHHKIWTVLQTFVFVKDKINILFSGIGAKNYIKGHHWLPWFVMITSHL